MRIFAKQTRIGGFVQNAGRTDLFNRRQTEATEALFAALCYLRFLLFKIPCLFRHPKEPCFSRVTTQSSGNVSDAGKFVFIRSIG